MRLSQPELSFLRLLNRTKNLAREDLTSNIWKVNAAVLYLENLFSKLQGTKSFCNTDILMQYGRELDQMKLIVEAESCKSAEEKLSVLDRIPRLFPQTTFDMHFGELQSYRPSKATTELRVRNRTVYRVDLRRQLLRQEKQGREISSTDDLVQQEQRQENIATELLTMTRSLKESITLAGNVLKDDNKLLSSMHNQVDANVERLNTEGSRLAKHAYKCGFDCALLFVALFIFWSFICMVVVMKMFPKRVTS